MQHYFILSFALTALLLLPHPSLARKAVEYDFFTFDSVPGPFVTTLFGINDRNQMVGWGDGEGLLYDEGTVSPIHVPGSSASQAHGINDAGLIVGAYVDTETQRSCGFLYDGQTFTTLHPPGAHYSYAYGINDWGHVVGFYVDNRGGHGFRYIDGTFTTLNFPGTFDTRATGINRKGQIVGFYTHPQTRFFQGFLYQNGTFTTIACPEVDLPYTELRGISDKSDIVGYCLSTEPTFVERGFLYRNGVFTTIQAPNSFSTFPFGINRKGWIVGYQVFNPEPGLYAVPRKGSPK